MKTKSVFFSFVILGLFLFTLRGAASEITPPPYYYTFPAIRLRFAEAVTQVGSLLINGDMDDPTYPFYWRPTNHYVAGMWYEWWIGSDLPEFIDGGHPHHNSCYPVPADRYCYNDPYYNLSQGYIRYGGPFTAGIYQVAHNVTPCTAYRFEAYNQNEYAEMRTKVGIEPTGWQLPIPSWANPPDNCPPTGSSKCPDPKLNSESDFPATMVWSAETTMRDWHPVSVTAEALSSTVTVWTYAAAHPSKISHSVYWDYTSLVQAPYPADRLPTPQAWNSTYIQNMAVQFVLDKAYVTWTTPEPTYGQVWYTHNPVNNTTYASITTLDQVPSTQHVAVIEDIQKGGDRILVAALARRFSGGQCVTDALSQVFTAPEKTPNPSSWAFSPIIKNVVVTPGTGSLQVTWDTTIPVASQLWYAVEAPPAPFSGTMMLGATIYMPFVASTHRSYPFYTLLQLTPKTHHSTTISGLEDDKIVDFIVVVGYVNDGVATTSVSADHRIYP
ncbi:MAG: hypothetical protein JXA21_08700 [Anaerolineae bacterium]|nr:hypothetical protein [Anaerolineae bacterium]